VLTSLNYFVSGKVVKKWVPFVWRLVLEKVYCGCAAVNSRLLAGVDWELRSQLILEFQPPGGALINSPPDGGEYTGPEAQSTFLRPSPVADETQQKNMLPWGSCPEGKSAGLRGTRFSQHSTMKKRTIPPPIFLLFPATIFPASLGREELVVKKWVPFIWRLVLEKVDSLRRSEFPPVGGS
jgi:hypothetical protein